jgi:hypothetical protein
MLGENSCQDNDYLVKIYREKVFVLHVKQHHREHKTRRITCNGYPSAQLITELY